jgi:hypothetical protein
VQRAGYSESEVETDMVALELETDMSALKLESGVAASASGQVVCQELLK